ncbi:2OG-Fe dioxygenase family protein [Listeria grandensis]|uniref:2OG-Fe dioxygenase family protein n=1 Tax=Listeria grandensis TaxID=1494963 RepID=UPI001623972F|nr:2OG-Fe dioxygenase family protein [Listeria grandensis]MBC1475774.1 2OG-Fe dioxygenase family protein [Listeria grandensis]
MYKDEMLEKGFIRFHAGADIGRLYSEDQAWIAEQFEAIERAFEDLPMDAYATGLHRYRRFSRAVILPWSNQVEWLPAIVNEDGDEVAEYFQGAFNPEFKDAYRSFPMLQQEMLENELLKRIIQFDFAQTYWDKRDMVMPVNVGVHFVKLKVERDGDAAVSSPNCLHRDGEPFTFAHLVRRQNVVGGLNVIATVDDVDQLPGAIDTGHIFADFVLTEALESYGVADVAVSHYVSAVHKGTGDEAGERSMILIDYQPTVVKPL